MDLDDYQHAARRTAIYADHHRVIYPALGLASEAAKLLGGLTLRKPEPASEFSLSSTRRVPTTTQKYALLRYCGVDTGRQTIIRMGMMPAKHTPSRLTRVSVLLSDDDAGRFEAYCRDRGFKKSTLIARLIREYLDRERYPRQPSLFPNEGVRT